MWKNRGVRKKDKAERHRGRAACAASVLFAAMLLTACAGKNAAAGQDTSNGRQASPGLDGGTALKGPDAVTGQQDADWLAVRMKQDRRTKHDLRTEPEDMEKAEQIDLNAFENGRVILAEGGDIRLSGSLEGQVIVDAEEDELVHLYLEGVEITSPNGPAIQIREAAKTIVTLVSDTENVLSDSPDYTGYEEMPACFYSVCDLTINGDGALRVFGYHEDGIRGKDRIKVLDGALSVQAKGDGIRGNDGIYMQNASVDIESEKNGLRTANQGANDRGVIEINGGAISVIAGQNGVSAASDLYLYGGRCSVNAVEEKLRAEGDAYIADGVQGL